MRHSYFLLLLLFWACGTAPDQTDGVAENQPAQEIVEDTTDLLQVEEETPLFDMNPQQEHYDYANEEVIWPSYKYFEGKIGENAVLINLQKRGYDDVYVGRYVYTNNGTNFKVEAEFPSGLDTVKMRVFNDSGKQVETIGATMKEDKLTLEGQWVKDSLILPFKASEVVRSPQETQLYVNLTRLEEMHNTEQGIISVGSWQEGLGFNSFSGGISMGMAYDFGQEWTDSDEILFRDDSVLVFVSTEINNYEATRFKEGHGPSGPDCEGCVVEGMEYGANGKVYWKVIENGVVTEDELEISKAGNFDTWAFEGFLIFTEISQGYDQLDKPDSSFTLKWNSQKRTFEEQ